VKEKDYLDRVTLDLDNLRAALRACIEQADLELGLTISEALEPLWVRGTRQQEGLRWFEQLFALDGDIPPALLGASLVVAGRLAVEVGHVGLAKRWYHEGLQLTRVAGDEVSTAWALHGLGHVVWDEGDLNQAHKLFEESFELFLKLGDHAPAAGRLTYLAAVALDQGDNAAARVYLERARQLYGLAGDVLGVAWTVAEIGDRTVDDGDFDEALTLYREGIDIAGDAVTPRDAAYMVAGVASALAGLGRRGDASRLWGAAARIEAELEVGMTRSERGRLERLLGELDAREVEAGGALRNDEAFALAHELSRASGS